jgi:hypothetical protein
MKRTSILTALLLATLGSVHASTPEIREARITQSEFSTDVRVEMFVREFTSRIFLRLRCEIFDSENVSLGVYQRDLTGSPYRPLNLLAGHFYRPSMRIERVDADHAACRFATNEDALPTVSTDEVQIELLSIREFRIINNSAFHIARVDFKCRGPLLTTLYSMPPQGRRGLGIWPSATNGSQVLPNEADKCSITALTVSTPAEADF